MKTCVNRVDNELRFKNINSSETFFLNDEQSRKTYSDKVYIKIDEIKTIHNLLSSPHYYNAFCFSNGNLCHISNDTPVQRVNVKLVNDD